MATLAAPDSALDALLITVIVLAALAYCVVLIVAPKPTVVLSFSVALCFAGGYFCALGLDASRPIAGLSGGGVLLTAVPVFAVLASKSSKRDAEERRLEWKARQAQAGKHADMRRYWRSTD
ncbi:hypothetical protein [Streptomyces sp. NPDC048845]|uniref:hypothetical protein n=1 Tax=Streptomyces sp. NPDC048845 TaxID=3155390 RepID=UPI00341B698D